MTTPIPLPSKQGLTELAHELRNPLASILSSIELIQALGQHSEGVPRLLDIVDDKVKAMTAVIDRLFIDVPGAAADPGRPTAEGIPPIPEPASDTPHPLRVLIVDDNAVAADSLGQILALRGYEVAVAYSGAQGFEKARVFLPRAAILDIGMPEVDGYILAGMIQAAHIPCVLIALTGYGREKDKQNASEAGFDFHITKPTRIDDIEAILRTVPFAAATTDA